MFLHELNFSLELENFAIALLALFNNDEVTQTMTLVFSLQIS